MDAFLPVEDLPVSGQQVIDLIYNKYQLLAAEWPRLFPDLGNKENWRLISHPYFRHENIYGAPFIVEQVSLHMIQNFPRFMIITAQDAEAYMANPPDYRL